MSRSKKLSSSGSGVDAFCGMRAQIVRMAFSVRLAEGPLRVVGA